MKHRSKNLLWPILLAGMMALTWLLSPALAGAKSPPITHTASYAKFYSGYASDSSATSPCTGAGCANGIQYDWSSSTCYHNDRYPPIAVLFTISGKVSTKSWPLNAPCSTGLKFFWDKNNQINGASWVGVSGTQPNSGLAVCFKSKNACNPTHCATAGCIPQHTTGVDIFFEGSGDKPTAASWLFKGKSDGSIAISGSPNSVFWYGHAAPSSPYATPGTSSTSAPAVTLAGRNSKNLSQDVSHSSPSNANGVAMSWYQPGYESGPTRGCHQVNGVWYASFPLVFAYTTNGALSGPVTAATCATNGVNPIPFSHLEFSWASNGGHYALTTADPVNHGSGGIVHNACTGSYEATTNYPPTNIPQPPVGSNGVVLTFSHDDGDATCWTHNGVFFKSGLSHPSHTRYDYLQP